MLNFESDYTEGAHENILKRLLETNMEQLSGYGCDKYCESAKEKIRKICDCPDAEVNFLVGGTQTNSTVIDALLKSYQGVIAAKSGHVNTHEAGAIEFTGHKVMTIDEHLGKIKADELDEYVKTFFDDENHDHMVFPGMVYISHPTEFGTLYTKDELKSIYNVCKKYELPLFVDGARLGYGLMAKDTDVDIKTLAKNCDVFYIGGTKVGALCGEAVVFSGMKAPKHFMTIIKQHGALLAKGRLLGIQFDTLFTDDLYFKISKNAIETAEMLKNGFKNKGYKMAWDSPTNQQFFVLQNTKLKELADKNVLCGFWEKFDENNTVVRFATSWTTKAEDVKALINML